MSDAAFDPALLDALARCFAEAALRRLLAEQSEVGANSVTSLDKPMGRTDRVPALLTDGSPIDATTCARPAVTVSERTMPEAF